MNLISDDHDHRPRTLFPLLLPRGGSAEVSRHLALRPRYPSMPRRPRPAVVAGDAGGSGGDLEAAKGAAEEEE
jgi:Cu+-exporting ATPase